MRNSYKHLKLVGYSISKLKPKVTNNWQPQLSTVWIYSLIWKKYYIHFKINVYVYFQKSISILPPTDQPYSTQANPLLKSLSFGKLHWDISKAIWFMPGSHAMWLFVIFSCHRMLMQTTLHKNSNEGHWGL